MSNLFDYLPKPYNRVKKYKDKVKILWKEIRQFLHTLNHTLSLYESNIVPAKIGLDKIKINNKTKLSEEQVEQCKIIFENSLKRREILQTKADKIISILVIFTPLFTALITYIFSNNKSLSTFSVMLYISLGISILGLLLAFIAAFRTRRIGELEEPFIASIIDHDKNQLHKYSTNREGFGYLYCAMNNQVKNDHLADFVRAAEYLVLITLIFLIISLSLILTMHIAKGKTPSFNETIIEQTKSINTNIDKINHSLEESNNSLKELNKTIIKLKKR